MPTPHPVQHARLRADLLLLITAVVWGSAFAAQRAAANQIGVFLFNGSRFLVGALALLVLIRFRLRLTLQQWLWAGLAGVLLVGAAGLQQAGMMTTTAANAGFITTLYVVIVPLFLVLFFKQRVTPIAWAAALLATVGAYLLSTGGASLTPAIGDLYVLLGAFLWAAHVLFISWLMQRVDAIQFSIGQFLVCGVISLGLGLLFESNTLGGFIPAGWAVVYTGLFSVGIGYTLQAVGQKDAPPTDASIILSLEAVFAAIFGFILLQEGLTPLQVVGCAVIFAAVMLAQFPTLFSRRVA